MRTLVFNSKGGCGKSLIAREVIAAPKAKEMIIVEIDTLNTTQLSYKKDFKDVIELSKQNINDLLSILNEHDEVVIDVGADNLTATLTVLVDYQIFEDIDLVVIPMTPGRTDCENALQSYSVISQYIKNIMFAFSRYKENENIEDQYQVFFKNMKERGLENIGGKYITINDSEIFIDAQNAKELVINMAENIDYKGQALKAKNDGNIDQFHLLMKKELNKRAAKILVDKCILPAHKKLMAAS
ncbi:MAG: hypothetical protein K9L22_08375 [Methylococcaceae bacterium]|nr:hypothetical protein [Methylococcaceae bacterium]